MENCTQNDGGVAVELRVGRPLPRWEKLAFMYISIMLTMDFLGPCVGARSAWSLSHLPPTSGKGVVSGFPLSSPSGPSAWQQRLSFRPDQPAGVAPRWQTASVQIEQE